MAATFTQAIAVLNTLPANQGNFAFRMVREAVLPSDYFLSTILPDEQRNTYNVDSGALAIYPTMAGLTGMDSAYAPVGAVVTSRFLEESAKVTGQIPITEKMIREIQANLMRIRAAGGDDLPTAVQEMIAFTMMLAQCIWDTNESLRGMALFLGAIDWTYNGLHLTVDYLLQADNKPSTRTGAAAYDKANSAWWTDTRKARKLLGTPALTVMNRTTFYGIVDNSVNQIKVEELSSNVSTTGNGIIETFRLTKRIGDNAGASDDARDSVTVTVYERGGSILDPSDRTRTKAVEFVPDGRVSVIGRAERAAYRPGRGAAPDLTNMGRIGYTHIAPTTEGNNEPGPWANVRTPDGKAYMVIGEVAENVMPVIESPDKLVILSSEIGA